MYIHWYVHTYIRTYIYIGKGGVKDFSKRGRGGGEDPRREDYLKRGDIPSANYGVSDEDTRTKSMTSFWCFYC